MTKNKTPLFALDFDGVICDSALETGMAGWKAAVKIWADMPAEQPAYLIEQFRLARPILETGFEAILIIRLLFLGESVNSILQEFDTKKAELIASDHLELSQLKKLFSDTRDHWIENNLDEWLAMNPLFPGVAEKLHRLSQRTEWYILTTKQERFVSQILNANAIELPESRIFGMDKKMDKNSVLLSLKTAHPEQGIYFIEDRLPALLQVRTNPALQEVQLQLTDWGFNTQVDRDNAHLSGVAVISLHQFLAEAFS